VARRRAHEKEVLSGKKEKTMGSKGKLTDWPTPSADTAYRSINHLFIQVQMIRNREKIAATVLTSEHTEYVPMLFSVLLLFVYSRDTYDAICEE
jgi:hypothetical protein